MSNLEITTLPLADLTQHPDNPRRGDVDTIAESLEANGQYKPIIVSTDNVILAGNHTAQAAVSLGWTDIDAVRLPVTGDSDEGRRILLADNRSSDLGSYDDEALMRALANMDDLAGTGYNTDDLDDLQHIVGVREVVAGSSESHYDGAALAADGVIPDRGLQALQDDYAAKAIRSVILAYTLEDFDEVTRLMAQARAITGTESNADAILAVLRDI